MALTDMTQNSFALVTIFNTIVCIDRAGALVHEAIESCTPNLFFEWSDGKLILSTPPKTFKASPNLPRELVYPLEVMVLGENEFGIIFEGKFACAEKTHEILFNRDGCAAWERFTTLNIAEIYKARLGAVDCFVTPFVRHQRKYHITKTVHQVLISNFSYQTRLSDEIVERIANLRALNPGWDYKLWTKKEIYDAIYEWYGFEVLDLFLKINPRYPAARADLFRYLCIYKLGGVYLDLKAGLSLPLDSVIDPGDQYILSQWHNGPDGNDRNVGLHDELRHIDGGEFQMWHVIGSAGHPFLERVLLEVLGNIRNYSRERFGTGRMGVLRVTGPIAYSLAI